MEPEATEESPQGVSEAAPPPAEQGIHPRPPSEPAKARWRWQPSNLTLRLLTAAVLIPPILWLCQYGGLPFVAMITLLSCLGVHEFYNFIEHKGATPHRLLGILAAGILPLVVYTVDAFLATSFLTAVLLGTMVLQLTKQQIREAIESVSATFFGVFYVGWLFSHAVSIRFVHEHLARRYGEVAVANLDPEIGFFFVVLVLGGAFGCDSGAYFVGRRYGRHKLAPSISPNKTVEGALGGLVAGSVIAVLVTIFFTSIYPVPLAQGFPLVAAAAFGLAMGAAGILGDLIESVLKRDADVKDAGRLLPGVGGILDRADSILLAFPVMFYMLLAYYYVQFVG